MNSSVKTVSIFDTLKSHANEYLYFRTDHHWTQLGAYYAYVEFCNVRGFEPVPLDQFDRKDYTGYLGTFYSNTESSALANNPDTVEALSLIHIFSQYYPKHFSVVAVTADPCFGGVPGDYSQIQGLCDALGVPYIIRKTYLGPLIFEERKEENPCSLCARMRRGILHNICCLLYTSRCV